MRVAHVHVREARVMRLLQVRPAAEGTLLPGLQVGEVTQPSISLSCLAHACI